MAAPADRREAEARNTTFYHESASYRNKSRGKSQKSDHWKQEKRLASEVSDYEKK